MADILLVDDEIQLCARLVRALEMDGHTITVAHSLHAAGLALDERQFDAAVVDLRLPDGSGLDLLRWLRDERARCARVLFSGHLDLTTTLGALNRGEIARVLTKPVGLNDLRHAVAEALEQAREHDVPADGEGQRRRLEGVLDRAEVELALQPVVDSRSGSVVGYEGLMRCGDDQLSDPRLLLGAARRHRMLRRLTEAVMSRACGWLARLPHDRDLFLNLHPDELADMGALKATLGPLAPHAHQVVLDISGRHQERWGGGLWKRLDTLRALGFRFALDDVGAGHQGLLMLAQAEPGFVKADRSIIADIDRDASKRRLLEMLARFAQVTDARLVAEGVETDAEAAVLAEIGVPLMQGYLFGRPSLELPIAV